MDIEYSAPYEEEKYTIPNAGDFGTFFTDNKAPVFYLNTSFKIDFIGRISPVREILDVSEVDFDELVQRDLDDFRIRRDIIPYLTDGMGYKFFPPIVAAMTQPSKDKKAIKKYYPTLNTRIIESQNAHDQLELEFENSFCIRWYLSPNNKRLDLPVEIRWNSEFTYLMAVDGQHRLVALQAIRGLIEDEELKTFYKKSSQDKNKLKGLKVPVTILFFPNSVDKISEESEKVLKQYFPNIDWSPSTRMDVKQVLRNIFVDVNKSAKQPTKSRTILLDEKDLSAVFSRNIFSSLKDTMPNIYTALLEYNSSSGNESKIDKNRPIITTIGIVNTICDYLFEDSNKPDQGSLLRSRLGIYDVNDFPESDEFPISEIKKDNFSLEQRKTVEQLFRAKWLDKFTELYTKLIPFKILIQEVRNTFNKFKVLTKNESIDISGDNYKLYKALFGGSEQRNIVENNAKLDLDEDSKLLFKSIKEKEREIRNGVRKYDFFYTLMFQEGFFKGIVNIISENILVNDHYMKKSELDKFINQLNFFIQNNPKNSIFDFDDNLNNLIFYRGRAKPEYAKIVGSLIVLIALNYKNNENSFTESLNIDNKNIEEINEDYLSDIEERMISTLGKDFDYKRENKVRKQEVRMLKDDGRNTEYKKERDKYEANKSEYIHEKIEKFMPAFKKQIGIEV